MHDIGNSIDFFYKFVSITSFAAEVKIAMKVWTSLFYSYLVLVDHLTSSDALLI